MVVLEYSRNLTSFGSPNGTIYLNQLIELTSGKNFYVKCISAMVSSSICNIYNVAGDINNGLIRVSGDGGNTWVSVQLQNGAYSLTMIQDALNAALAQAGWWANANDPGITMGLNTALQRIFIYIDSTKLSGPGQIVIDLSHANSLMYQVLGYNDPSNRISSGDGIFESDSVARIDWFGSELSVHLVGFGPLGISGGQFTQQICLIPIKNDGAVVPTAYFFPINGIIPPKSLVSVIGNINQFEVRLRTKDNRPVYLTAGEFRLTLELNELKGE